MPRNKPTFLDGYLPYLLRQADQTLSAPFYAVLTEYGVSRSEWRLLSVLDEKGRLSVAELAVAALSPQPTVTHALRRLEDRGLISRSLGTTDKRQRFVAISPAGVSLTAKLVNEATALQNEALAEAGDLSDLIAKLNDLTALVEAHNHATAIDARQAG